ncbi:MAG: RNase adapter RapZ [Desulfobacterales bacterium]|nr:RNase adapter RapZ [Desulfobacterales bacterium]
MKDLNIIIITGLSGSGKSTAIDALEDVGYFCVDNMPISLLPKFLTLRSGGVSEVQKLAFGMDLRQKQFVLKYREIFHRLREEGYHMEILFLEASEEILLKRYSQTRRQHPVFEAGGLIDSIRAEREQLKGIKEIADRVIDTSNLTVHQLKDLIIQHANRGIKTERMRISLLSFGFKYGIPLETDLLIDVRFIPNPYFTPELKSLNGKDEKVKKFVNKWPETKEFFKRYFSLLEYLLPLYKKEGKSYLTIAVGCTGGKHRSVAIAEEIFLYFKDINGEVTLTHRDIEMS